MLNLFIGKPVLENPKKKFVFSQKETHNKGEINKKNINHTIPKKLLKRYMLHSKRLFRMPGFFNARCKGMKKIAS